MLIDLSNNLNILMAKARLSSSELARKIGIPATTIKRIRNNEQANPTITTLLPIAQFFSISLNQLIGTEPLNTYGACQNVLHKIPILSWQECMHHSALVDKKVYNFTCTERHVSNEAFALINEEEALDFFPKKSILLIEPYRKPETGDFVIIGNVEKNTVSIRKYIIEIDQIYLKSLVKGITISTLTLEYKVIGVILQYKVELK